MPRMILRGTVFDGTGAAPRQADVVLDEGRITAVGSAEDAGGAAVLDFQGATILPGLIDCHVHLTSDSVPGEIRRLKQSTPYQALVGAAQAERLLRMGFTTVRDVGAVGYANVALSQAIRDGWARGPRVLAAGPSLSVRGGHGDSYYRPEVSFDRGGLIAGPQGAREAVRETIKMGAEVVKLLVTGGVMTDGSDVGALQWTHEELQAAIDMAHQLGVRVAGHCHGAAGVKAAVRAGIDTIEHGTLLDDEAIALMAEHGTYYVPTLVAPYWIHAKGEASGIPAYAVRKADMVYEQHKVSVRKAREAGVRIAMGTDCGTPFNRAGDNARELELLVQNGLQPSEALQAITRVAAEALGLAGEIGTLEVGKRADLVVVNGDPLRDVRIVNDPACIRLVVKGGEVVYQAT